MTNNRGIFELILAIESAIAGGSLSLISGETELDGWIGNDKVSRAEELLPNIIEMLERQRLGREMISNIAVSLGPGSFTGIRIGIATALGLKNALNIPCVGISALEAMAASADVIGIVMAALPVGRDLICFQDFEVDTSRKLTPRSEPTVVKSIVVDKTHAAVIAHESIATKIETTQPDVAVIRADVNLAGLIGLAAKKFGRESLEPIFIQPT